MLVMLGALSAGFVALLLAPLYRRRAARLAISDLKRSMPLTDAEIRADKDRLRAQNAIAIHRLETRLEDSSLRSARQRVEINRRDAAISSLESEVARLGTILDEHENARRVLEQTITERLPMVERRLTEAKELLSARDREISVIKNQSDKTADALDEARQINAKQREELHRLNATLASRQAHNRSSFADAGIETEIALRGEIEALRAKARDQSDLIERLKANHAKAVKKSDDSAENANTSKELQQLRIELAEAQQALRSAMGESEKGAQSRTGLEKDLQETKNQADQLRGELSRLKAALNVYEDADKDQRAAPETKAELKARIGRLEADMQAQAETIQRYKSEIAANNDKMARQAAHYVDVIRKLGGGTQPVSGPAQAARARTAPPSSAAETTAARTVSRADPLLERLKAPRKDGKVLIKPSPVRTGSDGAVPTAKEQAANSKVSDFISALGGQAVAQNGTTQSAGENGGDGAKAVAAPGQPASSVKAEDDPAQSSRRQRRPGLLERLAGGDKSAG